MLQNEKILYKYFLPQLYYRGVIEDAREKRMVILDNTYPHTVYTELGLATEGGDLEMSVIKLIELDEQIARLDQVIERIQKRLNKALNFIETRERIILFVYFKTGLVLTNRKELYMAQEQMINILDDIKEKEGTAIEKEWRSNNYSSGEVKPKINNYNEVWL